MGKKVTTEDFIIKANLIHNDKYHYTKVKYINVKTKIVIICPIHGAFEQTPNKHLGDKGCSKCGFISRCNKARSNTNEFIVKAMNIHGDKFDYTNVEYTGRDDKVNITCSKHGDFLQTPHNHLKGHGCPVCRESKGEMEISEHLKLRDIIFEQQKRFSDCRNILPLPFDFYLPEYNMCIEYQGIQHYKPRSIFGGEKEFNKTKKRDLIKVNYCEENGITLIKIKYSEDIKKVLLGIF